MFSTSFQNELRYVVVCIANGQMVKLVDAIVDTGAFYTCFLAHSINPIIKEDDLKDNEIKELGGFVDGKNEVNQVRFYRYHLKQFSIGNIDMGSRDIWITFDDRISDNVLGMDILKSIDFLQLKDTGRLYFFSDREEIMDVVKSVQ